MKPLDAVREVERELAAAAIETPRVDAELLVGHVLGVGRSGVYAVERALEPEERARLEAAVARRRRREPLAYVLGEWGFRRLTLGVDRRALVPRPETEVVVERALALVAGRTEPRVLDVGTGSGAIALAIADERADARVWATDVSTDALALAAENRARTGLAGRVELVLGSVDAGLAGPFDLVVSNPPYVALDDAARLEPEIRLHEPAVALYGTGMHEAVARRARELLAPGGGLVLEVGDGQAASVAALLGELGFEDVRVTPDLTGRDRAVEGRR